MKSVIPGTDHMPSMKILPQAMSSVAASFSKLAVTVTLPLIVTVVISALLSANVASAVLPDQPVKL